MRAIKLNMRHVPLKRLPITPDMLKSLCEVCDSLDSVLGKCIKVALLLAFCGYLRQSNLAPRQASMFDPTRNTCRGDVLFMKPGLVIIHKWSKSQQTADSASLLPIPAIPRLAIDPVEAYRQMIVAVPTRSANDPLLSLPAPGGGRQTITTGHLRICFRELLLIIGADPALYSLHSLRRGGASTSHQLGVSALDIQKHGKWKSRAFLDYIMDLHPADSRVATTMASALT